MKFTIERVNQFLLFFVLITVVFLFGAQVLKPVMLAIMLAMLMTPVCIWLDKKGLPRPISSLICVFILLLFIFGILSIVTAQLISFSKDWPLIEKKINMFVGFFQNFIEQKFSLSPKEQTDFLKKQVSGMGSSVGKYAGTILTGITGTLGSIVLMLVFTFLFLFDKEKFENFFIKLYKEEDSEKVKTEINEISKVSQNYLTGRAISMGIQAIIYAIGLSIIGIKNGILLGCIAGLLTILPYVGTLVGGLFPVVMSLVTEDSSNKTLWVIALLVVIQVMDNYFIEPNVVGGKVKLNAFFTILIIIIGGLLWGVVGMLLFTPILGIVKIIFSHADDLKPYAYLIGDEDKPKSKSKNGI